jgi:hypothetical protein
MLRTIWLSSEDREFEADWMTLLLEKSTDLIPKIEFAKSCTIEKNSCVLLISSVNQDYSQVIRDCINTESFFGLVLLSDEWLRASLDWFVNSRFCIFVARNYYDPKYSGHSNVWFFGLGFKNGFRLPINNEVNRVYIWTFCGNIHTKPRKDALNMFENLEPNLQVKTSVFNSSSGLKTSEYRNSLEMSIFGLCPQGYVNNDSFRLYETLEAGGIPVCLKSDSIYKYKPSYWHAIFESEDIPFIVGNSWAECHTKVKALASDSNKVDEMRLACLSFWQEAIGKWQLKFSQSIDSLIEGKPIQNTRSKDIKIIARYTALFASKEMARKLKRIVSQSLNRNFSTPN